MLEPDISERAHGQGRDSGRDDRRPEWLGQRHDLACAGRTPGLAFSRQWRLTERALLVDQGGAHCRNRGDGRGGSARQFGPQIAAGFHAIDEDQRVISFAINELHRSLGGASGQCIVVIQVDVGPARGQADGPVQRARYRENSEKTLEDIRRKTDDSAGKLKRSIEKNKA